MKTRIWSIITLIVIIGSLFTATVAQAAPAGTDIERRAASEILVKFRDGGFVSHDKLNFKGWELEVAKDIRSIGVQVLRVAPEQREAVLKALQQDPRVEYAEPNAVVSGLFSPNDPYYNDPSKVYAPQKIQADLAWDYTLGDASVIIAIVDSGVDASHPEFAGRVLPGWDFVNDDNDPTDDQGHGTHVAGIAAAAINNGEGIAGIAGQALILPVKVLNENNQGTWADVVAGIVYAVDHGARVINLSLGGTIGTSALQDAIEYAWNRNAVIVAAAGNDGSTTPYYPAAYDEVIAVSATTPDDVRWSLSSYGPHISVAAPGVTIYSTNWTADSGSTYGFKSGTSMAAPHVSGIAALLLAQDGSRTNAEVRQIIEQSADDLGPAGWDEEYGYGRVNAYRAVTWGMAEATASLSGMAWNDVNGDGIHDPDEVNGVPNVPVVLRQDGQVVAMVSSDNNGFFQVEGLQPGLYEIEVEPPPGMYPTTPTIVERELTVNGSEATEFGFVAPTAVQVVSLEARAVEESVELVWTTMEESPQLLGFHVYRSQEEESGYQRVTEELIPALTPGAGGASYTWRDTDVEDDTTYYYRLSSVRSDGYESPFGPVTVTIAHHSEGNSAYKVYMPTVFR